MSDIQVVKGDPTPEELAALVIAIRTQASQAPNEPERVSDWAAYWRNVRRPLQHGPGQWRASARPG